MRRAYSTGLNSRRILRQMVIWLMLLITQPVVAETQSVALTGRLADNGVPTTGPVDLQISYYDAATAGQLLGDSPYSVQAVDLRDGAFNISLPLTGEAAAAIYANLMAPAWVEITDLTHTKTYPRYQISVIPYALRLPIDSSLAYTDNGLSIGTSPQTTIAGLSATLAAKADTSALTSGLAGKAKTSHTHAQGDVANLSTSLGSLAAAVHTHTLAGDVSGALTATTVTGIGGLAVPTPTVAANSGNYLQLAANGSQFVWTSASSSGTSGSGSVQGTSVGGVSATPPLIVTSGANSSINMSLPQASSISSGYVAQGDYLGFVNLQGALSTASVLTPGTVTGTLQNGGELQPYGTIASQTSELRLDELSANGVTHLGFKAPDTIATSRIWALPSSDGAAGQGLTTNGAGALSWITPAAGTVNSLTAGSGLNGGVITSAGTVSLPTLGTPGTYTRPNYTAYGFVAGGQALTLADLPPINLNVFTAGTLSISYGGTGSSSTLTANGDILSFGRAVTSGGARTNGQVLIGSSGSVPQSAVLTSDATQSLTIVNNPGAIQLDTVQDVRFGAAPNFSGATVTGAPSTLLQTSGNGLWQAVVPATITALIGYTPVNKAGDTMNGLLLGSLPLLTTNLVAGINDNTTSATAGTVRGPAALGTNIAGSSMTFDAPNGTGTGGSGGFNFLIGPVAASSATPDPWLSALRIAGNGFVGVGLTAPSSSLDLAGALTQRGQSAPSTAVSGQGRIYFDNTTNHFYASENTGGYNAVLGVGSATTVVAGSGFAAGTVNGTSGTLNLLTFGALSNMPKVGISAQGMVASGVALTANDIPALDASRFASGALGVGVGGLGVATLAANGVVVGNSGSAVATLAAGASNTLLIMNGSSAPVYGALNLAQSAALSGVLPVTNGGTGVTSGGANNVFASPNGASGGPGLRGVVSADYPTFLGDTGSGGTKGAVPAANAGDGAAPKFLGADGNWDLAGGFAGGTSGQVMFSNGTTLAGSNGLFWDKVNKRLGIGTVAPASYLDVSTVAAAGSPSFGGVLIGQSSSSYTDTATSTAGTASNEAFQGYAAPTLAAANASVTTTNAYTYYLAGAPKKGTNNTAGNTVALAIGGGTVGAQTAS